MYEVHAKERKEMNENKKIPMWQKSATAAEQAAVMS